MFGEFSDPWAGALVKAAQFLQHQDLQPWPRGSKPGSGIGVSLYM